MKNSTISLCESSIFDIQTSFFDPIAVTASRDSIYQLRLAPSSNSIEVIAKIDTTVRTQSLAVIDTFSGPCFGILSADSIKLYQVGNEIPSHTPVNLNFNATVLKSHRNLSCIAVGGDAMIKYFDFRSNFRDFISTPFKTSTLSSSSVSCLNFLDDYKVLVGLSNSSIAVIDLRSGILEHSRLGDTAVTSINPIDQSNLIGVTLKHERRLFLRKGDLTQHSMYNFPLPTVSVCSSTSNSFMASSLSTAVGLSFLNSEPVLTTVDCAAFNITSLSHINQSNLILGGSSDGCLSYFYCE
ncbi:hypothetical protein GEMRC1_009043 [Eukaryota sp. GEM-RC1]